MTVPATKSHKPNIQAQALPSTSSAAVVLKGPDAPADADEVRPYILGPQIGKGSFATVFKGYHEVRDVSHLYINTNECVLQETQQTVAIKSIMRDKLAGKLLENLQGEINILKSLSHRHITKLIDITVSVVHAD